MVNYEACAGLQDSRSALSYDFGFEKFREEVKQIKQKQKPKKNVTQGRLVPLIYESESSSDEDPIQAFLRSETHLDANKLSQKYAESVAPERATAKK